MLGLLAAWGLRRRKHPAKEEVSLRPRAEAARPVPSRSGASYEQEQAMYGEDNNNTAGQVQQRTGNSSGAAAAAAAAAAVTGTAGVAATKTRSEVEAARPAPEPVTEPERLKLRTGGLLSRVQELTMASAVAGSTSVCEAVVGICRTAPLRSRFMLPLTNAVGLASSRATIIWCGLVERSF